jgi:hypothetical protein
VIAGHWKVIGGVQTGMLSAAATEPKDNNPRSAMARARR